MPQEDINIDDEMQIDTEPPAGDETSQGEESQEKIANDAENDEQDDDQEELEVSFDDEKEDTEGGTESGLITDLRQRHRSLKKKYRQALHELEQVKEPQRQQIDPGPKPTLEQCDYDTEQFEAKLSDWYDVKRKADEAAAAVATRKQEEDAQWQKIFTNYTERRQNLKVRDYKDAEEEVAEQLSVEKQNVILKYAKKPELVIYALGKSPAKLAELAKLDAFEFAKELGRLEDKLKVGKRKPKTQPEKTISSTGTLSGTTDRTLDKLREEAARTGNMTKVLEYKRRKRKAAG